MTDFLHGTETIDVPGSAKPVREVKTAVIGIVGTAPVHRVAVADKRVNVPVLVRGDVSAAKYFGSQTTGYTIPAALADAIKEGASTFVVVNVFDPEVHQAVVAGANRAVTDNAVQLPHGDLLSVTVKVEDGGGDPLVEGTDYDVDLLTGIVTILEGGALEAATAIHVGYTRADPSLVDADDIIGEVDETGARIGAQAFLDAFSTWGFHPKILIAPGYSTAAAVRAELGVLAQRNKLRAIALADAPVGTTTEEAILGRGPEGDINFNVADPRVVLCYPHLIAYDLAASANGLRPYSQALAGVIARVDRDRGYWVSPSNKPLRTALGMENPITFAINNPDCDANTLNAAGILTVVNSPGGGLRTWGNRSSAFPGSASSETFIQSLRTADVVHESLELAMLDYLDDGLSDVTIKAVLAAGNAFMRKLVGRRAVPPGSRVEFNTEKNPVEELAQGHATFDVIFVGVPPMERVTFESFIDINLLANLFA